MTDVTLTIGQKKHTLTGERRFTFGRGAGCDLCLLPADNGISRLAGSIELNHRTWWLINRSRTRSLAVVDETRIRKVVAKGQAHALSGTVTILVEGSVSTHALTVEAPRMRPRGAHPQLDALDLPTDMGNGVRVSDLDKRALLAMFAGYLADPPHYDPHPRTYDAAAARLDWPRTTLLRRIEYLRKRLTHAGVPHLHGPTALTSLAEYVIQAGIISKADLRSGRRP